MKLGLLIHWIPSLVNPFSALSTFDSCKASCCQPVHNDAHKLDKRFWSPLEAWAEVFAPGANDEIQLAPSALPLCTEALLGKLWRTPLKIAAAFEQLE